VCVQVRERVCTCLCNRVWVHVPLYVHSYLCVCLCRCRCVCNYTYVFVCVCVNACFCLYPGKVFVNCAVGVSRSAAVVLAYLMIHRHLSLVSSIRLVQQKRWVFPNRGFLQQLIALDRNLQRERDWKPIPHIVIHLETLLLSGSMSYLMYHHLI
jgi:hypothetical protein